MNLKHTIYLTLEKEGYQNAWARRINTFLVLMIFANVITVILHTVKTLDKRIIYAFDLFEIFSVIVFSTEYIMRIWVCTENPKYTHPFKGRVSYLTSPMSLIDLLSILPFFLTVFTVIDPSVMDANMTFQSDGSHVEGFGKASVLRFLAIMRFARLLRIFKLRRYSHAIDTLIYVIRDKKEELVIIFFTILFLLILSSSIMYLIENREQPETFSSIPATMWWGIATLTTVGYGDMYPITPLGKFFGAIVAVLGIAMFALPAGLISSGFTRMLQKQKKIQRMEDKRAKKARICPHCGKETDLIED